MNPETGGTGREREFYADLDAARKRPGCLGCGGCLTVALVLLLLVVGGLVTLLAATGIVRVPLVSSQVYPGDPQPKRVVQPATATELTDLLASKEPSISASGGSITITEQELTGALRQPNAQGELTLKLGQVAIDASGAELYGQIQPQSFGQPVILRVLIAPADGGTSLEATSVMVGYVPIPLEIARSVLRLFLGLDLGTTAALEVYGVETAELGSGSVTLSFEAGGINLPGLGATLSLNLLTTLEKLGIDPSSLNQELTPEVLEKLRAELGTMTPQAQTEAESAIPQIKRLDQEASTEDQAAGE